MRRRRPSQSALGETLEQCRAEIESLLREPELRGCLVGVKALDYKLARLGRHWLSAHGIPPQQNAAPTAPLRTRDVYLASRLYADGGHTALIGDFVRASKHTDNEAADCVPHLILTEQPGSALSPETLRRTGIPIENVRFIKGESAEARLEQLFAELLRLKPARLFLFHHPEDPLPCVVAQAEVATRIFMIRHSDGLPSLGIHLPGVRVIDLHPYGASMSRLHQLTTDLLLLTCPDPGPRTVGFLQEGALTTASCGSPYKFDREYLYEYPETIALVLKTTGGKHVHIGPLYDRLSEKIRDELNRLHVPLDRFVHVPWVHSLCHALWEHGCDLYFSSFPIDGARVNVEVAASATPHLNHRRPFQPGQKPAALALRGSLSWHTWEELQGRLKEASNPSFLEELSQQIRQTYERLHSPEVFGRTLASILRGEGGMTDPDAPERDGRNAQKFLTAIPAVVSPARAAQVQRGAFWRRLLGRSNR